MGMLFRPQIRIPAHYEIRTVGQKPFFAGESSPAHGQNIVEAVAYGARDGAVLQSLKEGMRVRMALKGADHADDYNLTRTPILFVYSEGRWQGFAVDSPELEAEKRTNLILLHNQEGLESHRTKGTWLHELNDISKLLDASGDRGRSFDVPESDNEYWSSVPLSVVQKDGRSEFGENRAVRALADDKNGALAERYALDAARRKGRTNLYVGFPSTRWLDGNVPKKKYAEARLAGLGDLFYNLYAGGRCYFSGRARGVWREAPEKFHRK